MFKNYLLITLRNIRKNKVYSFINIAGLAAGIAICLLITLFIESELGYDSFNKKADRIYRIVFQSPEGEGQTRTPHPMAQALVTDFPEVEKAVTISPIWGAGLTWAEMPVKYKDKQFFESRFFSADTNFFDVFSFKSVRGNAGKAIREAGSLIITESIANKYFGNEDPVGKFLKVDGRFDMMVRAVIEDIPDNSHFKFDFLISYLTLKPMEQGNYYTWKDFGHYNYIVLKEGADAAKLEAAIPAWSKKYIDYSGGDLKNEIDYSKYLKLQQLKDIHLKSHLLWELEPNGNMSEIYIFSAAAILILLIACINFMNISTARSMRRAKEVGVRKTLGAERKQLVIQFLSESFLMTLIASVIAIGIIEMFLPFLDAYTGKKLSLSTESFTNYSWALAAIVLFVGLAAGSYPAFFLSAFKPESVLKGKLNKTSGAAGLRKVLVVFQFSISIFLITSTLVIYSQLNYFRSKDLGFNKEQVIALPLKDGGLIRQFKAIKTSLLKSPYVVSAAGATNVPGGQYNQETINWKADTSPVNVLEVWVDQDYFKTLDIPIIAGRAFSESFGSDTSMAFVLNEAAANKFNWDTPVGKELGWYPEDQRINGTVVGVVKDFNYRSLHENITPLLIHYRSGDFNNFLIKLKAGHISEGIADVKNVIKEFSPDYDFEFSFLDEFFARAYKDDDRMGTLFLFFSVFAIIIASLGLFGLTAFMAEQKTKEIGIRKILGASVPGIVMNLGKGFMIRVLAANLIAWPAAYYVMNKWLQDFAYHISLSWWMFAAAGILAFIIACLTVSWQAVKAALANPVSSLKYE